jgi:hypothetical protein
MEDNRSAFLLAAYLNKRLNFSSALSVFAALPSAAIMVVRTDVPALTGLPMFSAACCRNLIALLLLFPYHA